MWHRRDLSLSEKYEILKRFDDLEKCSQRQAALKLGIAQSSLHRILSQRDSIVKAMASNCNIGRKRKRGGKGSPFEETLLKFYEEHLQQNGPVSKRVLYQKAEELAKESGLNDFKVTDGWLSRWKQRNNLTSNVKNSERLKSAQNWTIENLPYILKNYYPDHIYNADVVELNIFAFSVFCDKSSSSADEDKIQEKVSVLLVCNMVGDRKIPLVVGRNKNHECLKNIKTLPVKYEGSGDALITREIFVHFLLEWDKKLGSQKIVIILDCSFSHFNDLSLRNIKMIFLPPDLASVIHPIDQGIMKSFKLFYKKNLQATISDAVSDGKGSAWEIFNNLTLLDAMHSIAKAWLDVSPSFICNCFKKAGFYYNNLLIQSNMNGPEERTSTVQCGTSHISASSYDILAECDRSISFEEEDATIPSDEAGMTGPSEEANITPSSQETYVNVKRETEEITDSSNASIEKDTNTLKNMLDKNVVEDNPPTAKETRNALSVIQKTLEQRGASVECYELFYKMQNEVCKLLQKTQ